MNCIDRFVLGNVSKKEVTQSPKKRIYWDRGVVFCFVFFFFLCCKSCVILVPLRGIEPMSLSLAAWSLNSWTTGNSNLEKRYR